MAYSKHTWSTNDVITTALMNALETGAEEAYLWSEAVIDSDKDMSGNSLTGINALDASGNINIDAFKTVASDNVKFTALPDPINAWETTSSVMVQLAEFQMPPAIATGSVVRIKTTVYAAGSGTYRVYVNDVAVGTAHAIGISATYTDDITLTQGDLVQMWGLNAGGGGSTAISQIQFCYRDGFDNWVEV